MFSVSPVSVLRLNERYQALQSWGLTLTVGPAYAAPLFETTHLTTQYEGCSSKALATRNEAQWGRNELPMIGQQQSSLTRIQSSPDVMPFDSHTNAHCPMPLTHGKIAPHLNPIKHAIDLGCGRRLGTTCTTSDMHVIYACLTCSSRKAGNLKIIPNAQPDRRVCF